MNLDKQQLAFWHNNGYLLLKKVLNPEQVAKLRIAVDDVVQVHEGQDGQSNTSGYHGKEYYNIHNPLDYTTELDYLLDYQDTFDIVLQLMGPYIKVMGCHVFVRHPSDAKHSNIGKFHTDSGPSLQQQIPDPENPALQLKFQYFLTDIQQDNASNFIAIPGSHRVRVKDQNIFCLLPECNQYLEQGRLPPDAIQLKVEAGDVLIHALTLWHAVAPNFSQQSRKSISIRYGQMWFQSYHFGLDEQRMQRLSKRQQRLLGCLTEERGDVYYRPPADHLDIIYQNV